MVSDLFFFFFKQKTAYEMRISDWSSDVCSSDLLEKLLQVGPLVGVQIDPGGDLGAADRTREGFQDRPGLLSDFAFPHQIPAHDTFGRLCGDPLVQDAVEAPAQKLVELEDRKSTRLNSSH